VIFAVGLGATTPAVADAIASPGLAAGDTLAAIGPPTNVMLGGGFNPAVQVSPDFVGLTPGLASLYQINFTIPQNAPTGNSVPLTLNIQGSASQQVNIAIQ